MGNVVEALANHRRAVELDPSIMTLFNLGVTLEEGNVDINEAISVHERALRLDAVGSDISPPGCHREMISEALADAYAKCESG